VQCSDHFDVPGVPEDRGGYELTPNLRNYMPAGIRKFGLCFLLASLGARRLAVLVT